MGMSNIVGGRSLRHRARLIPVIVALLAATGGGLTVIAPAAAAANYPPVPSSAGGDLASCLHPATMSTIPEAQMDSTIDGINALAGSHVEGIGPCASGQIALTLTPGSEGLAKRIRSVYGRAILTTIGLTVWDGHAGRSPRCGSLPSWTRPPNGLAFSLQLPSRNVRDGGTLTGTLIARNRGDEPFEMDTGSTLEGVLVKAGTHDVVGVFSGGIAGTGFELSVGSGETSSPSAGPTVLIGTARCDGGIGSALPPGRYQALVLVMDETDVAPRYLTPPVNLTVTSH
jgi:hypothetical protein